MKKKYLLLIPLLFLICFVTRVKAIDIGLDSSVVFEHDVDSNFKNFVCSDGKYFVVNKNENGDYIASWNFGVEAPEGGGSDTITCSYDEKYGESGAGTAEYTITFTTNPATISIYHDLVHSDPSFTLSSYISKFSYVKSINLNYDASRLSVNCSPNETLCTFKALKFDQDYEVTGYLVIADTDGHSINVDITLRIHQAAAYAAPGGYGTCAFDTSVWEEVSGEVTGGYDGQLFKNVHGNVTLPECNTDNAKYPLLKFAGWLRTNYLAATEDKDFGYNLTVGKCTKYSGFIAGGNINIDVLDGDSNYFFSCYDYVAGVEIIPNGGTIDDTSGWTETNGVYIKAGSATLPNVTAEGYTFLYWSEQGTKNHFNAGETITVNEGDALRSFIAVYEQESMVSTYSYNIEMIKGKTEELGTLIGDKVAFASCNTTSSSIVATNYNSGECIVTAVEQGEAVIKAEYENDTYIIGVKVYASQADYDEDHTIHDDEEDPDNPTEDDLPESVLSVGSETVCKTYTVSKTGQSSSIGRIGSYDFDFNFYTAKSNCDDGKEYNALCLDPGQAGPKEKYAGSKGDSYTYSKSLDFVNSKVDAGYYYLVSQIAGESFNESKYIAVNLAGRVLQFVNGEQNNNSIVHKSHHNAYVTLANRSKNGELGDLDVISNSSVYNLAKDYFREASKASYTEEDKAELEVQVKDREVTGSWSGDVLTIHNTGTLILPKGSSNAKLVANCSLAGYECSVNSFTATGDGLAYTYDVSAKISASASLEVPDADTMEKVSFKLSFDNSDSSGNAFIITHRSYANHYQRMILINPGQAEYLLYLQWPSDSSLCDITKPYLNPDNCTKEDCSQINKELFWKLKCCTKIVDKTKYAYEYLCTGGDCTYNTLLPVCEYDPNEASAEGNEMFQIDEATDSSGEYKFKCIVAIDRRCTNNNTDCDEKVKRAVTDTKKDLAGNKFSLDDYQANKYCRVSCKEDWNFSLSKFGNFTGDHAVNAGSYFQIKNDVFIGGSRTCVTTKIDYEKYQSDQEKLAKAVVAAWNDYVKYRAEYSTVKDTGKTPDDPYTTDYYDSSKLLETDHCYGSVDSEGNCSGHRGNYYGTTACNECRIKGAKFEHIGYKDEGTLISPTPTSTSREDTTTNTTVGTSESPGSCESPGMDCGALRDKMLSEIEADITAKRNEVEGLLEDIKNNALDFSMCQNFILYTTIPSNGGATGFEVFADKSSIEMVYDNGTVYTNNNGGDTVSFENVESHSINTVFGPFAKYTYEEDEYMKLLGNDNYMIPYLEANNKAFDPNWKNGGDDLYKNAENECGSVVVGQVKIGENTKDVKVCRHYYTTQWYMSTSKDETENDIYANEPTEADNKKTLKDKTETFGTNKISLCNTKGGNEYEYSGGSSNFGLCHTVTFYYYKINYIKQTLTNSSYWRNKMDFYESQNSDEKLVSEDGVTGLPNGGEDWTLLGGYNVFPISMDTRRNLYQYTYLFYNIGMYSDGKVGRIMGGEVDASGREVQNGHSTHLVDNNAHACFYEVYESICRCCGEKIVGTVVLASGVSTSDYIADNGYFYAESDYVKVADDAALGLYTSTVSLSNVASSTQRVLGANWKAQTPFYLSGTVYSGENGTDQGAELLDQIQVAADGIYDQTPDYSFTLNPAAISEIRNYNKSNSYGIPKKLKSYGNYGYTNDGTGWIVKENQKNYRIRFNHFGSDYLEYLNTHDYTTEQYRGMTLLDITGPNAVCLIDEGNVADIYHSSKYKNCRWVDYLTNVQDKDGNTVQVRLAFK